MTLPTLPIPQFVERDPAAIVAAMVADYEAKSGKTLYPAQVERLLIDMVAYRETLTRMAIQEAACQNLLAFANFPMLDYLGELVGVVRLPDEGDERLRDRIREAPNRFSSSGPRDAYRFHAMSVDATITDAAVLSPTPGLVEVYLLTSTPPAPNDLLSRVKTALNDEKIRPLSDQVAVKAAEPVYYTLDVALILEAKADAESTKARVTEHLTNWTTGLQQQLGRDVVPEQVITEAMRDGGVWKASIKTPLLTVDRHQYPHCTGVTVTISGVADD